MVVVLLGEQLLTAIVGIGGGLWPAQTALLLHLLIVGQLLLDAVGLVLLLRLSGFMPSRPRLFALCLGGLILAAAAKNLHVSPSAAAADLLRLVVPLLWLAVTPVDDFAARFLVRVHEVRYILIAVLAAQAIGLAAGRITGWGAAYLSGDPLVGFLIFPILINGSDLIAQIAIVLLSVPLLVVSLKRTAWLSTIIVITLLALASFRKISGRAKRGFLVVGLVGLGMVLISIYGLGAGAQVVKRVDSFTAIATNSASDYSFTQRVEEVTTEASRIRWDPLPSLLFGVSSEAVRLPNRQSTHAIHVTPLFLLFGGGLLWLGAFVLAGRKPSKSSSGPHWLLTFIALGTLLDSLGGNDSLAPSFGFALAILHIQVRRLVVRGRQHWT